MGLASEVNGHERASFHEWVRQEDLQEKRKLLCSLLQKGRLRVADVLFLWEGGRSISAANLPFHHGLELSDRGIPIFQVEGDVFGSDNVNDVIGEAFFSQLVFDHGDFKVD